MPTIKCSESQGLILKKPIDPNHIINFGYVEECIIWVVQDENQICFVHQHILSDPQEMFLFIAENFSGLPNIDIKLYGGLYTTGEKNFDKQLLVEMPSSIMMMKDKEFPDDYLVISEQRNKMHNGTMNTAQHNRMNANFILHFLQKHVESSMVKYESLDLSSDPNKRGNIIYKNGDFEEGFPSAKDVYIAVRKKDFESKYSAFDVKPSTHMKALFGSEIEQDLASASKESKKACVIS